APYGASLEVLVGIGVVVVQIVVIVVVEVEILVVAEVLLVIELVVEVFFVAVVVLEVLLVGVLQLGGGLLFGLVDLGGDFLTGLVGFLAIAITRVGRPRRARGHRFEHRMFTGSMRGHLGHCGLVGGLFGPLLLRSPAPAATGLGLAPVRRGGID